MSRNVETLVYAVLWPTAEYYGPLLRAVYFHETSWSIDEVSIHTSLPEIPIIHNNGTTTKKTQIPPISSTVGLNEVEHIQV